MAIINDDELKQDIIDMLVNNFGIDEETAKKEVTEEVVLRIANWMYEDEEQGVSDLAERINNNEV